MGLYVKYKNVVSMNQVILLTQNSGLSGTIVIQIRINIANEKWDIRRKYGNSQSWH